jgi:hypothetical protein
MFIEGGPVITSVAMVRIATLPLLVGLGLAAAGVVTCVTAAPDDPRAFPAIEDLLIIGGIAVMVLGSTRERRRPRPPDPQ